VPAVKLCEFTLTVTLPGAVTEAGLTLSQFPVEIAVAEKALDAPLLLTAMV